MPEKNNTLPEEMTIAEASAFWDTHSVADYSSHVVEMDYEPDERLTIVAIAANLSDALQRQAEESGVSIETLVNLWVQEKLTAV